MRRDKVRRKEEVKDTSSSKVDTMNKGPWRRDKQLDNTPTPRETPLVHGWYTRCLTRKVQLCSG